MVKSNGFPILYAILLAAAFCVKVAEAQINHGCPAPAQSDFRLVQLVNKTNAQLTEPMKMDFDMDAQNNTDIYFVERNGRASKYDAKTKAIVRLGQLPAVKPQTEHGLTGIALDPGFKTNRYIYFFHSTNSSTQQVSRYTLNGAGTLDMASAKMVIQWGVQSGWHSAGAMKFDNQGNLFIAVGENNAPDNGPANTNDLRGNILRIKINADGTYGIPAGNLFPPGTAQTKPEIYVMGVRNPYTINYDNKTGRLVWGCIGPDGTGRPTEEHNMTTKPGFFGWPYFAGKNEVLRAGKIPSAPINNAANNTGLQNLPPAQPALHAYGQASAITGPIFRYNGLIKSAVSLPPHFDGVWFTTDYNRPQEIDTIGVNAAGTAMTGMARVFTSIGVSHPLDMQQGPDGALYVLNYGGPDFGSGPTTTISRVEYTGPCRPELSSSVATPNGTRPAFAARGLVFTVGEANYRLRVTDLKGREVYSFRSEAAGRHDLTEPLRGRIGIHMVTVQTPRGSHTMKVVLKS